MARPRISVIEFFNLESGIATEYRRLLHNIQQLARAREIKSILVTSSMLAEGKSNVCAFLALTAAKKGIKALLIDSDLRRPTLHKLFAMEREPGLAEALAEGVPARNVVRKTSLSSLDVITAGRPCSVPAEVFDAPAIGRIVAEMKFYYDIIIVDCAPVIPVSDPMLLSHEVDGVLFVVKAGSTQRDVVLRARDILSSSTDRLLGVVLNNSEDSLPYYYSHEYYGYDYRQKPTGGKRAPKGDGKESGKDSAPTAGTGANGGTRPVAKTDANQKNSLPQ